MAYAGAALTPPRGLQWPLLVGGLIAAQVALGAATAYLAVRDPAHTVTPGYHAKALAWDEEAGRRAASAKLGWKAAAELVGAAGQRELRVSLHDRAGQPIIGATVQATVFHHARAKEIATLPLTPAGAGGYSATVAVARSGVCEVRLVVRRGGDEFHWTNIADYPLEPSS
jgi:nitrogen fixation protein FixH